MAVVPTVAPDGKRIREVRTELGLSCAALAAKMPRHRHPKTINRIERGEHPLVSQVLLAEIADALGKPVAEFVKTADAA